MPPRFSMPSALEDVEPMLGDLSSEDSHEFLDSVIVQAQDFIRSIGSLRNARAKISRLPKEILSTILVMAVQPASQLSEPVPWCQHVQLTGVCTFWRSVALQTPGFWACIPLNPCQIFQEMLARSKAHPFSVRIHVKHPFGQWHNLEPHLPALLDPRRLVDFHLWAEKEDYLSDLTSATRTSLGQFPLDVELPLLCSLKIAFTSLPKHILTARKPSLRHVIFDAVQVDWTTLSDTRSPHIANLLTLDLTNITPPVPLVVLHGIISSSPGLRFLKIVHSLPKDLDTDSPLPKEVFLGLLRVCQLHDTRIDRTLGLLQWMKSPRYGPIWIIKDEPPDVNRNFNKTDARKVRSLMKTFGITCTDDRAPPYRTLAIDYDCNGFIRMTLRSQGTKLGVLSITLSVETCTTVLLAFNLPRLHSLYMRLEDFDIPYDVWYHFFKRMPRLLSLRISCDGDIRILDAAVGPSPRKSSKSPFLLPRLEVLKIEDMSHDESRRLSGALAVRLAAGFGLKQLTITHCQGFSKRFIREVETTVARVIWDGVTCWTDNEYDPETDSDASEWSTTGEERDGDLGSLHAQAI